MLSLSAEMTQSEVDIRLVDGTAMASEGDIAHARLLEAFATTIASREEKGLGEARDALAAAAGDEVVVDAAAVAANFQRMVRIADSTGIPLDEMTAVASVKIRRNLDLERFATASHTPEDGLKVRLLSLFVRPMTWLLLRSAGKR